MLNPRTNRTPASPRVRFVILIALLGAASAIASAQSPFATISGVITDQNGGIIPDATIALTHVATDARYEVRTNTTGSYEVTGLRSGDYQLAVVLPGFSVYREELTLSPGQLLTRNAALTVGTLEETITVVANPEGAPKPNARRAQAEARTKPSAPCTMASAGGNIRVPTKLLDVRPIYPENLRAVQTEGVVRLLATIGTDGKVQNVDVKSSPNVDMANAAAEAVRQWEFSPTLLNCAPVEVSMTVAVNFKTAR